MRPALRLILDTPLARYDADARDFIQRVERADGQALETGVRQAIDAFVRGCKADGIWNAIKASCILAGARTLSGALVPLKGTAPTNFNFVSGDYNRKTGLVGNGSTKYLNANRSNDADPQDSKHLAVYVTAANTSNNAIVLGTAFNAGTSSLLALDRVNGGANVIVNVTANTANGVLDTATFPIGSQDLFFAVARSSASNFTRRRAGSSATLTRSSAAPTSLPIGVFAGGAGASNFSTTRLAYYSIGESLNLALLDTRVTTLINTLNSVIP